MKTILIIILLTTSSYAGVDFSKWGGDRAMTKEEQDRKYLYYIPRFNHPDQATKWAHYVKYIPALYERIAIKKENFAIMAVINQHPRSRADMQQLLIKRTKG